jgi:branched-chain amino acid transport system permease protein
MWNLLAGTGGAGLGRPSGLLETGSYALVTLADLGGLDPFVCVPLGRLIAGLAALPISRVAFRLQGGDFAIGTWVITEVFRLTAANTRALGGGSGQSLISMRAYPRALREAATYWMALALLVLALASIYWLLRSRFGIPGRV